MSEQVGNTVCVSAYPLILLPECCEVWASHFPFLHNVHDTVPPIEVCLMVTSTGLWHMLTNNPCLDCPSLQAQ